MFLDDRKKRILQAIIEDYVRFAEPIASKIIVERYELDLSSATIRNEMAALEELGLIEKTHTSSGRVPSDLGYRYYVDSIMNYNDNVDEAFENSVEEIRNKAHPIDSVSKILSYLTHYTAISADEDNIYLYGRNNVFDYPEFRDIEKLKRFMYLLEEEDLIKEILDSYLDNGVTIKIGDENLFDEVKDYSIITFGYQDQGKIAVIGPKRMDYSKVMSYINYLLELEEREKKN
ncbi:MAG: hypothetical protein IJS47_06855 [Clostridia bacterium]|nr:hypothetical protein [Clostridia bacterium]